MRVFKHHMVYTLLGLVMLPGPVWGQAQLQLSGGVTGYAWTDLGAFHDMVHQHFDSYDLPLETVQAFPPYSHVAASFIPKWFSTKLGAEFAFGVLYRYASTGGRIHYRDYSGELRYDQIVVTNALGIVVYHQFPSSRFGDGLTIAYSRTELDLHDKVTLGDESLSETTELLARGIYLEPRITYRLDLFEQELILEAGIPISFTKPLALKSDPDAEARDASGNLIEGNYVGIAVTLTYPIGSKH